MVSAFRSKKSVSGCAIHDFAVSVSGSIDKIVSNRQSVVSESRASKKAITPTEWLLCKPLMSKITGNFRAIPVVISISPTNGLSFGRFT